MTKEARKILEDMVEMALSHEYSMNKYFCCVERSGSYMPPDQKRPSCHPLEALVIGQAINDYINVEVAKALGVELQWVDGFIDGYAGNSFDTRYEKLGVGHPDYSPYLDGFRDGHVFKSTVSDMEKFFHPWEDEDDPPF